MEQRMEELTERALGAVFEVANELGCGFLEKVYERALVRELGARGIRGLAQAPLTVAYKGQAVGEFFADILVEEGLVLELKCVERLANEHMAQCLKPGTDSHFSPTARKTESVPDHLDSIPMLGYPSIVRLELFVYVLHCFEKKATRGIATPKRELDVIRRRLKEAREEYRGYQRSQNAKNR